MNLGAKSCTAICKVGAGTALYLMIVLFSTLSPSAAGMMLTFPTFNGLTLALTSREKLPRVARIMFLIPPLNGLLCACYIYSFRMTATESHVPSLTLFVAVAVVWGALATILGAREIGVSARHRLTYVCICSLLMALTTIFAMQSGPTATNASTSTAGISDFLWLSRNRILLFVTCLIGLVLMTDFLDGSAKWLGPLGGFPLIAFFGIFSVADGDGNVSERINTLDRMGTSVWLSPVIAIWFIYGFLRYLESYADDGSRFAWLKKIFAAAVGWAGCLCAIGLISLTMQAIRPL